ncbi:MAG TPA: PEP-CTERM sorting domain-containing protein [Gammaproteobacteria bacterium]|nr:PEP-CTERM sorting domain-containing protein [Gammaproteobacteria bacterium]
MKTKMCSRIHLALCAAAVAGAVAAGPAQAIAVIGGEGPAPGPGPFGLYTDFNGFSGTGAELADALVTPGGGLSVVPGSAQYQGNFDGTVFPNFDDDGGFFVEGFSINPLGGSSYGSAALLPDGGVDFGTIDGADFSLPGGILLTSGFAAPPLANTETGFSGLASGTGDAGLDELLAARDISETTRDATVLAFDFITDNPAINAVGLDFMFGSEEYPEFVDAFPDIAAVFVDEVNYAGFADGNLLTVTSASVGGGNFFDNNLQDGTAPLAIEYDGMSRRLRLIGMLDPDLDVHSIKLAISDTGDRVLDSGLFAANLEGLVLGGPGGAGFTSDDPLLPIPGDDPSDGFDFVVTVGDTGVGIDPTQPIFIDPPVATGYIYETAGPNFATVVLPTLYPPKTGDDNKYNLFAWNGSSYDSLGVVAAGVTYDFLASYASGVSKFKVTGIEPPGLDPSDPLAFITGVTFVSGGTFGVTQTPIVSSSTVPEPGTALLLMGGLLGWGYARRRRVC